MTFTGTIEARVDAKGRVFFPAQFRKQLAAGTERFVLARDVFQPCLVVYPYAVWQAEVDALSARLNRWDRTQAMILRQFQCDVEVFELDASGRFLIPRRYLAAAEIGQDVRFIGLGDRLELWSVAQAEAAFMPPADFAQALEAALRPSGCEHKGE